MITALPWQHQIIVAEFWVAAFFFIHWTRKYNGGEKQYGPRQIGWVLSDLVMIVMLVWGVSDNGNRWLYLTVLLMYVLSIAGMTGRILERKKAAIPKESTGAWVAALLIATIQTLILVGAQP